MNQLTLPYWRKDAAREAALALQKKLDSFVRKAEKAIADKLLAEAKSLNDAKTDTQLLVHVFSNDANGKVHMREKPTFAIFNSLI